MGPVKGFWARKWRPHAYYHDLSEVPFSDYFAQGYRLVLLDIDNTLTIHGQREKSAFAAAQLERIREAGIQPALLSNAKRERAAAMGCSLGIPAVGMAMKPGTRGIVEAASRFDVSPEQILLCGDQIFTDVWAGRRAGIATILVVPHAREGEPVQIRLKRIFEDWLFRRYRCRPVYDELLMKETGDGRENTE